MKAAFWYDCNSIPARNRTPQRGCSAKATVAKAASQSPVGNTTSIATPTISSHCNVLINPTSETDFRLRQAAFKAALNRTDVYCRVEVHLSSSLECSKTGVRNAWRAPRLSAECDIAISPIRALSLPVSPRSVPRVRSFHLAIVFLTRAATDGS